MQLVPVRTHIAVSKKIKSDKPKAFRLAPLHGLSAAIPHPGGVLTNHTSIAINKLKVETLKNSTYPSRIGWIRIYLTEKNFTNKRVMQSAAHRNLDVFLKVVVSQHYAMGCYFWQVLCATHCLQRKSRHARNHSVPFNLTVYRTSHNRTLEKAAVTGAPSERNFSIYLSLLEVLGKPPSPSFGTL